MSNIYCISGLGADHRFFTRLQIPDAKLIPVAWPIFENGDTMQGYAKKIAETIPEDKPTIMGLSFGGMLAVEIAKMKQTEKIILISSAKVKTELGRLNGILRFVMSNDLIPYRLMKIPNPVFYNMLGGKTKEEKQLLAATLKDTDISFVKGALNAIMQWDGTTYPDNLLQLHGTNDKVIMPANVSPDHWIKDGTHIMIYNRAKEISKMIADFL